LEDLERPEYSEYYEYSEYLGHLEDWEHSEYSEDLVYSEYLEYLEDLEHSEYSEYYEYSEYLEHLEDWEHIANHDSCLGQHDPKTMHGPAGTVPSQLGWPVFTYKMQVAWAVLKRVELNTAPVLVVPVPTSSLTPWDAPLMAALGE